MGGWELNAWDKPTSSMSPPSSLPQVCSASLHVSPTHCHSTPARQTFTQACGMQVDVSDCTNPGLNSGADQLSPQKERINALSAGDVEHSSRSSTLSMRTGKQASMAVANVCSMEITSQ